MSNLSRRKFIYAGAGVAAAAGLGYLTKDYWLPSPVTPSLSPNATLIQHQSSQSSVTEITTMSTTESTTPSKLVDLELQLFHDYHGDGAKQDDEPPITDAVFNIVDEKGEKILVGVTGNSDGIYRLEELIEGQRYRFEFSDEILKKYRNIAISNNEFLTLGNFELIPDSNQTRIELDLMNGYLTLPFVGVTRTPWYNVDRGGGVGWKGNRSYKGHGGTDFLIPVGTEILAPAPGRIIHTQMSWPKSPKTRLPEPDWLEAGNYLVMELDNRFRVLFSHISKLMVKPTEFTAFSGSGQRVKRGDIIALSGDTGIAWGQKIRPHLHFQIIRYNTYSFWGQHFDPYGENSAWTKANDPQYPIPDE